MVGFSISLFLLLRTRLNRFLGISTEVSALALRLWMKGKDAENVNELAKTMLNNTIESQDINRFIRSEKEKYSYQNELL